MSRKHMETLHGEGRYKTEQEKRADEMQAQQVSDFFHEWHYSQSHEAMLNAALLDDDFDTGGWIEAGWYDATFDEVERLAHMGWLVANE